MKLARFFSDRSGLTFRAKIAIIMNIQCRIGRHAGEMAEWLKAPVSKTG